MNPAAFPSPTPDIAEMNRIQYELEYTEGISQRMRIPEMLRVAPQASEDPNVGSSEVPHSVIMQVPDRIVVAGQYTGKCFVTVVQECIFCNVQRLALDTNLSLLADSNLTLMWALRCS